ncbi:DUF4352 domain-containing protein [Enterococcus faecalis]|uniref:DUF4352 domain-containing protein n=1 Tax=Enterococcus faecalis TaxID=1351 RepID=UPI001F581BF3|nr:DUF4352 domain-containing protein [Enterococcus faecalis]
MLGVSLLGAESCGDKKNMTEYNQNLELFLEEIHINENGKSKNKNILFMKIKAKNLTENKINLGSNDFVLKNKNRTIKPYIGGANFDEEIKKDQIIEGTMTFEISKNLKKVTLIYRPHEKDLVTWNREI